MTLRVFRQPFRVIASSCEAIQGHKEAWVASSQGLPAMTTLIPIFNYTTTGFGCRAIASVISAATMHKAPAAKNAGR
jgi:hypothetical protein